MHGSGPWGRPPHQLPSYPSGRGSTPPAGGEIGEAPPVADEASRFRGSAPIGGYDSARQSVGTTVGKRVPPIRTARYTSVGADAHIGPFCRASCYASVGVGLPDDPPGFVSHSLQKTMSLRGRTAPVAIRISRPQSLPCLKGGGPAALWWRDTCRVWGIRLQEAGAGIPVKRDRLLGRSLRGYTLLY